MLCCVLVCVVVLVCCCLCCFVEFGVGLVWFGVFVVCLCCLVMCALLCLSACPVATRLVVFRFRCRFVFVSLGCLVFGAVWCCALFCYGM